MRATVQSVDYAPEDLYGQVPFSAELIRRLPGPDRDDYWLGRLERALSYSRAGRVREISHVVLVSRYEGETIHGRVGKVTVGISYVVDESQVDCPTMDLTKCLYVAIGEVKIDAPAS